MLQEKRPCKAQIKGVCTGIAQGHNHPAGKHNDELYLTIDEEQLVCNACNMWFEDHHEEAVKLGFITKRNTILKRQIIYKPKN